MSGSQVSAGEGAATLKLERGGELRICPRTSLSVSASPQGDELMIGFNTGAIELHYTLATGTDTVMTPDFRIQMIGPGSFHLALAADARGATCVRALEGDGAGVIVNETMGSGSYQVAPDSAVTFAGGHVSNVKKGWPPSCGCQAPAVPTSQAAAAPAPNPQPAPPPEQKLPPETHLQLDTEMVYQGSSRPPEFSATRLSTSRISEAAAVLEPKVLPPPKVASSKPPVATENVPTDNKSSLWHRVGRFLAKTFGNG